VDIVANEKGFADEIKGGVVARQIFADERHQVTSCVTSFTHSKKRPRHPGEREQRLETRGTSWKLKNTGSVFYELRKIQTRIQDGDLAYRSKN
jgi:hypothetical protein